MGSIGNPKTWVPYMNTKDCSQGFCSLYCPQWCYIIFPPPPPVEFPDNDSGRNFSPLVISIIGILASAFLLVSYYTLISKYCGNADSTRRRSSENHDAGEVSDNNRSHEPWQTSTGGLDESLIKSITVCKFKKGDGLIEGTDCSVCLSEFQEDESLRLLPKCSHAFHVHCIDTWLRSHSNCPLCRANIIFVTASSPLPLPPPLPPPVVETPPEVNEFFLQESQESRSRSLQSDVGAPVAAAPKTPSRAFSDLGNVRGRNTVIEIREEGFYYEQMRRSVSMDHVHACRTQLSVADILQMKQEEEEEDSRVEENIQKTNTLVVNV